MRSWLLALLLLACARSVHAAEAPDDPRARAFFDVGVQAYGRDQYVLAIEAFRQAYKIVPRPGLLFSIAQAEHRQYRASSDERHLYEAIDFYQHYLKEVTTAGRRSEAIAALTALLPIADRLGQRQQGAQRERASLLGRLLVSSLTANTQVKVNGEALGQLPGALDLPDGTYRVEASAPGFQSVTHEIKVATGSVIPLSLELTPLPALLQVTGPARAELFVDGRAAGWLPLAPLSLSAGRHSVGLRKKGSRSAGTQVTLARGETEHVELELVSSTQRDLAWGLGIAGAVAGLTSGAFAIAAAVNDSNASDLEARRQQASLTPADARDLNAAVQRRERFRTVAIVSGAVSAAALASALVLYLVDDPSLPTSSVRGRGPGFFVAAGPGEAGVASGFAF